MKNTIFRKLSEGFKDFAMALFDETPAKTKNYQFLGIISEMMGEFKENVNFKIPTYNIRWSFNYLSYFSNTLFNF